MKIALSNVTDDPRSYVPRPILENKGAGMYWLEDFLKQKPPIPIYSVLSDGDKLAMDGQYIHLSVGDNINIEPCDMLTIGDYLFWVAEVDKEYRHDKATV